MNNKTKVEWPFLSGNEKNIAIKKLLGERRNLYPYYRISNKQLSINYYQLLDLLRAVIGRHFTALSSYISNSKKKMKINELDSQLKS